MPVKKSLLKRKNTPPEYLEVHIEENGAVNFPNLTRAAVKLARKISRKRQKHLNFYCG